MVLTGVLYNLAYSESSLAHSLHGLQDIRIFWLPKKLRSQTLSSHPEHDNAKNTVDKEKYVSPWSMNVHFVKYSLALFSSTKGTSSFLLPCALVWIPLDS